MSCHAAIVFPPIDDQTSPNQNERPKGARPDMLVLHYTGMPDGPQALARLTDPQAQPPVSSHYVVFEDGRIVRLVPDGRRAWHAGVSSWKGQTGLNDVSIGIEIVNPGHEWGYVDFPPAQIEAVINLSRALCQRWDILPERVLAHSDVAPTRKQDPGEKFPWDQLSAAGIGLWVPPTPLLDGPSYQAGDEGEPVRALQALFRVFGYGIEITGVMDALTVAVITAFQRHYRPERVDGIADRSTITTLGRLIGKLGAARQDAEAEHACDHHHG
ncbi:N-acetylmuramoyl-L-alanine amidase [Segnochrobactraceae bacterium EtOH-i3]